jgi:hypothetical protein
MLLARILEQPGLVTAVQALPPAALSKLVDHVGLEDAGEIIALATTEQLERVFEQDLFRSEQAGEAEHFDARRFPIWLEVMLAEGEAFTAKKLAELPEDLITLALHRQVLVIDTDALVVALANRRSEHDELLDKALDSSLQLELEQYRLFARSGEGWDAIVTALTALDRDHHELLQRMLERCCYMSTEHIEDNGGLYDVLSGEDMLEADVAATREDRRAGEGFVSATDAQSFLRRARTAAPSDRTRDPIALTYFRTLAPPAREGAPDHAAVSRPPQSDRAPSVEPAADRKRELAELVTALQEAEVLSADQPQLLAADNETARADEGLFRSAMRELLERDPEAHARRMEELVYLANVLLAGCTLAGRGFRPLEAGSAVVAVCNLGLELRERRAPGARNSARRDARFLAREHADVLFRSGWRTLYDDVVLASAEATLRALAPDEQRKPSGMGTHPREKLANALRSAIAEGAPWRARDQLDALETVLDKGTRETLANLLGEYPVLSGAPAEDGKSPDDARPPNPEFIATRAQLERARALVAGL